METKTDTRNDLFKRNEIQIVVEAEKNPSFEEAKKMVVEQTGKPEENLDVHGVKGSFGSNNFIISASVYDSKEDLEKAIQKTKKQRTEEAKAAEDVKKAEAEKPAEEKPAEEKPEEGAQSEDVPEQVEEKPEEKPTEAQTEDKPEEEAKAVEEEKEAEEESKE